ncbi:exo-alpha-sialidase [bacterium]|nr:exo-alpha-sialidase [bacterium]
MKLQKVLILIIIILLFGVINCEKKYDLQGGIAVFKQPNQLEGGSTSTNPPLLVNSNKGRLYASWISYPDPANASTQSIYMDISTDNGCSWKGKFIDIGNEDFTRLTYSLKSIALTSDKKGNLYLVHTPSNKDIFFTRSKNGGKSWINNIRAKPLPISFQPYYFNPSLIKADNGNLYLAYIRNRSVNEILSIGREKTKDYGLYISVSEDEGETWEERISITQILYQGSSAHPGLREYKDTFYLVYADKIYISKDKCESWLEINSPENGYKTGNPLIELGQDGNLYSLWTKTIMLNDSSNDSSGMINGNVEIRFSIFDSDSNSWSKPVTVNDTILPFSYKLSDFEASSNSQTGRLRKIIGEAELLDLAVSEGKMLIGVLWKDYWNGGPKMRFAFSADAGKTWSKTVEIEAKPKNASLVITDEGNLYVLWDEVYFISKTKRAPYPGMIKFVSGKIDKSNR